MWTERIDEMRQAVLQLLPDSGALAKIVELLEDIEQDYCSIVVVGEFKHGKSTFINALLGQPIMPADVTPTTATLNAVFYGRNPEVHVMKTDGQSEVHNLSSGVLERYTASEPFDPDLIQYIKVFYPSPLLNNRVVLIDTPGVNDLNEHRAAITHQFIPRADVVIFMLNMMEPLKRTEQAFMQHYLLRQGSDHLIFVANFADRLDDEEYDSTMEVIRRRLEKLTGNSEISLFSLSSREALLGKMNSDDVLLQSSGLLQVEEAIQGRMKDSAKAHAKSNSQIWRYSRILLELIEEIHTALELAGESMHGLQEHLAKISEWQARKGRWELQLTEYIQAKEEEIVYMALKSFDHFSGKLRVEVEQRVQHYHGPDLRGFAESQIPLTIKLQYTQWLEQYSESIQHLLVKLEEEITKGLVSSFRQSVQIRSDRSGRIDVDLSDPLSVNSGTSSNVKAGLLVGGVSMVALVLGGGLLVPIIGMAGLPFLQQKMAQKQLETVKPEVHLALSHHLDSMDEQTRTAIRSYIGQVIAEIKRQAVLEFDRLINGMQKSVENEITMKQREADRSYQYHRDLEQLKHKVEQSIEQLKEGLNYE